MVGEELITTKRIAAREIRTSPLMERHGIVQACGSISMMS